MQIFGDLRLALAGASTPSSLADDDLEDAGECDALQPGDLRSDLAGFTDRGGEGGSLAVDHLQRQPVDGRANGGQVAELAAPLVGWDAANPGDRLEDEFADRCGRGYARRSRADQLGELLLDLLVAIGDEPLLGRKIVIDRLLGDLGIPRHVANRDVLVSVLGEQ